MIRLIQSPRINVPTVRRVLLLSLPVLAVAGLLFVWIWVFSGSPFPLAPAASDSLGTYSLRAPAPLPRTEAGGVACQGKFYLAGGIDWRAHTLTSFLRYDPSNNAWETLPDLPEPLSHALLATDGKKVYMVGGFGPLGIRLRWFMFAEWNPRDTLYIFDPASNTWSEGPRMPQPRGAGGVAYAANALWYAGGIDQDRAISADLFRYDLENHTWARMPAMSVPRDHLRVEAVDGTVYAISGRKDDLRLNLAVMEAYDIRSGTWSRKADIPVARGGFGSAVVNGRIYTYGGEMLWHCLDNIERYDPGTDTWRGDGKLPEGRHGIMSGVIDGRIHLVSGGRHPRVSISGIHRLFTPVPDK